MHTCNFKETWKIEFVIWTNLWENHKLQKSEKASQLNSKFISHSFFFKLKKTFGWLLTASTSFFLWKKWKVIWWNFKRSTNCQLKMHSSQKAADRKLLKEACWNVMHVEREGFLVQKFKTRLKCEMKYLSEMILILNFILIVLVLKISTQTS